MRLVEDYLVIPRVLGEAVGLSPLIVLFAVTGTAVLFGGFAVLLAIPIAAVVATLVDVIVLEQGSRRARTCRPVIFSGRRERTLRRGAGLALPRPERRRRQSAAKPPTAGGVRPCASGRRRGRRA